MKVSPSQCLRALRHADVPWDVNVLDARDPRGVRHAHHGLLNAVLVGLATAKRTFRGVEETVEDLSPSARRRLGIPKSVSDSTLYRLIAVQGAEGFERRSRTSSTNSGSRRSPTMTSSPSASCRLTARAPGPAPTRRWRVRRSRAATPRGNHCGFWEPFAPFSPPSRMRPCIDMELIAAKEAESPTFRKMFPRLCKEAGRRFTVVTGDAGLTCRENALLVREHGKHFVFAVKGNQPTLHNLAQSLFWAAPNELRVEERMNGKLVVRELARVCFGAGDERLHMPKPPAATAPAPPRSCSTSTRAGFGPSSDTGSGRCWPRTARGLASGSSSGPWSRSSSGSRSYRSRRRHPRACTEASACARHSPARPRADCSAMRTSPGPRPPSPPSSWPCTAAARPWR